MFCYQKRLQYPVNIRRKDLKMAKYLVTQYGGSNGELAAALRYLNQKMSMPDNRGRALLNDIGVEELGHSEMLQTMVYQLIKDASMQQLSLFEQKEKDRSFTLENTIDEIRNRFGYSTVDYAILKLNEKLTDFAPSTEQFVFPSGNKS